VSRQAFAHTAPDAPGAIESKEANMIKRLKQVFASMPAQPTGAEKTDNPHDIRIATCALFLEMANIDGEFSEGERANILKLLAKEYHLSEEDAAELTKAADDERNGKIDLWQYTNLINQNYSDEEKFRVVELLWRVVYSDGRLDAHEDYLVHKLAKLLRLNHDRLIDAKLKVLHDEK
jgi:uncharacterized tellurite resistance protein B-like protein